jgi:hypothetical protein
MMSATTDSREGNGSTRIEGYEPTKKISRFHLSSSLVFGAGFSCSILRGLSRVFVHRHCTSISLSVFDQFSIVLSLHILVPNSRHRTGLALSALWEPGIEYLVRRHNGPIDAVDAANYYKLAADQHHTLGQYN